uniref:Translation initiation factor IF-2, mitochondrial n=1 Tax=Phallusia mammillata TaxID=59560 RepID=A0A6F9DKT5_9ASCI|nr:translation initiation factor IF-2, mitochondrial [Phallusia mammillata]
MFHMVKKLTTMTCKCQSFNRSTKLLNTQLFKARDANVSMQAIRCLSTTNARPAKRKQNPAKVLSYSLKKARLYKETRKTRVIEVRKNMMVHQLAEAANVKPELIVEAADILGRKVYFSTVLTDFGFLCEIVKKLGLRRKLEGGGKTFEKTLLADKDECRSPKPHDMSSFPHRPPIITIMGHVDHGKTTLLDYLRKTTVAEKEAGGITQKIGAFSVKLNEEKNITFLDTPGHAAFTAMRQRGAQLTDIVVLVVAADDGIMEQTEESIRMANESKVPIIVAINKCDSKNAKPEKVIKQLVHHNLEPEKAGGKTQVIQISAKTGMGISNLVESILLEAEMMDLRADPSARVEGVIVESNKSKTHGPVGSVVVQQGILKRGMWLTAGTAFARVKFITDENNKQMSEASPGAAVNIVGWKSLPPVGEIMLQVNTEFRAKEVTQYRSKLQSMEQLDEDWKKISKIRQKEKEMYVEMKMKGLRKQQSRFLLNEKSNSLFTTTHDVPQLNIIVKADVEGSLDAIMQVLKTYDCTDLCELNVISSGVGGMTENDLISAKAFSGSIILFNQSASEEQLKSATRHSVPVQQFDVIYHLVDHLKETLEDLIEERDSRVLAEASVLDTFRYKMKNGEKKLVAGCSINTGQFDVSGTYAIVRNGEIIHEGELSSIQKKSLSVKTVKSGDECGIVFLDSSAAPQPGDVIQQIEYFKKELTWSPPGF